MNDQAPSRYFVARKLAREHVAELEAARALDVCAGDAAQRWAWTLVFKRELRPKRRRKKKPRT